MMFKRMSLVFVVLAVLFSVSGVFGEVAEKDSAPKRAAIFVKNRAASGFDAKLGAFEDLLVAEIADMGFRVVSPEDSVKAIRELPDADVESLDALLESRTSATRLAQNMGVDCIVFVSVTTFGKDEMHMNRPDLGVNRRVTDHTLRASYKIVDAFSGDAVSAGTVTAQKRMQQSEGLSSSADVVNDLLADAACQVAKKLETKGGTKVLERVEGRKGMATFYLGCSMQDLSIPEVVEGDDGKLVIGGNRYKLEPMSVTVELDGVVMGSAPGEFRAAPGLHTIRLSRQNFCDWERTINVTDGQRLNVALTLTEEGRAKWFEMAEFFSDLKNKERMSEAEAELIRGFAQQMRQSGVRVDTSDAPMFNQRTVEQQNNSGSVWQ